MSNALGVAITHVFIYSDNWNGLDEAVRNEYLASAAEHGIAFTLHPGPSANPNQVVTVSDNDFTAIAAPFYLGPVQCDRLAWEHNLREPLDMDDPCFPNPLRDDPGGIRSL
jgi:hypothetical protein